MKINVVCSMGLGTSFIIRHNLECLLRDKFHRTATLQHIDLSAARSETCDLFVTTVMHDLHPLDPKTPIVHIEDVLDIEELERKTAPYLCEATHA